MDSLRGFDHFITSSIGVRPIRKVQLRIRVRMYIRVRVRVRVRVRLSWIQRFRFRMRDVAVTSPEPTHQVPRD